MNTTIAREVRSLIELIFKNEKNPENIDIREKHVLLQLKKSNTMSFVNKKEMDLSIHKMAEKFEFHGFFPQADYLRRVYDKYMMKVPKQDQTNALNIVRFLLYMSESPTNKFLENPEEYAIKKEEDDKEVINWGEYLLEGIDVYVPDETEDSSIDSDQFESANNSDEDLQFEDIKPIVTSSSNAGLKMDYNLNHQELLSTIQHTWYNAEQYVEKPFSQTVEPNIGILWDQYLDDQACGLLDLDRTSFISEYKVIREIIWQMFGTHKSFIFYFSGNQLKIRPNVSIASVRSVSFGAFLQQFLEYIELLDYFRNFLESFKIFEPSQTYICYGMGIKRNILDPIYQKLIDIEETVRLQEETYTLLNLAEDLIPIFEPLKILKEIHYEVVVPMQENSPLFCSTSLLSNLHSSLRRSITKLEHDIKLTLYLESLYKYFFLIDSWLTRNDFVDTDGEFVLVQGRSTQTLEYITSPFLSAKVNYAVNGQLEEEFANDGVIHIICNKVLQIAKNIRLLFLLRKFDFYSKYEETLHQELIRRILVELCKYFHYEDKDVLENLSELHEADNPKVLVFKYPVISSDLCKKPTEMDRLENLVDTSNSFLMDAFSDLITEETPENDIPKTTMTLLERIQKITTGLFPLRNAVENIFLDILKQRFSVSGLMVKGALLGDHHLDQLFEFLRALYLFCNANIFPFFQEFFKEMKFLHNSPWRYMKLSSNLKDVLFEVFPKICDKCEISLNSTREQCTDPLDICDHLNIDVTMKWPLNIVITEDEIKAYKSLFRFFIKLKWALHTLNGLSCKNILNIDVRNVSKIVKKTIKKLEVFKLCLLQLLNSIHHYVVCFCLMKCLKQFELDFEKSNDLDTVIRSHSNFVGGIEGMITFLQDTSDEFGFNTILRCVKVLSSVWYDLNLALDKRVLDGAYALYRKCNANIETKVNKIYLIHY